MHISKIGLSQCLVHPDTSKEMWLTNEVSMIEGDNISHGIQLGIDVIREQYRKICGKEPIALSPQVKLEDELTTMRYNELLKKLLCSTSMEECESYLQEYSEFRHLPEIKSAVIGVGKANSKRK